MLENNPYLDSYKDAPWPRKNMVHEDENVIVFKDGFPVTEGHLLFVPKKRKQRMDITICFEYAWEWGVKGIMDYKWKAFNIGINNGVEAGQSVMWPHVHLIPRREGDNPNPKGGVRNVIPFKGDYTEKNNEWLSADHWSKRIQENSEEEKMLLDPLGYDAIKDIDELHQRNRRKTDDPYIRATTENVDYKKWKKNDAERR